MTLKNIPSKEITTARMRTKLEDFLKLTPEEAWQVCGVLENEVIDWDSLSPKVTTFLRRHHSITQEK